jgi:DNA-binding transcriptional LysR family regulator
LIGWYLQNYPETSIELHTSTQHIDLAASQIDLALRGGGVLDAGLITRQLLRKDIIAVAHPTYLEKLGILQKIEKLTFHSCLLGFVTESMLRIRGLLAMGARLRVAGFASNDLVSLLSATLRALGIALLPRCFIQTDLENQRLIPVLEGKVGIPVSLLASLVRLEAHGSKST